MTSSGGAALFMPPLPRAALEVILPALEPSLIKYKNNWGRQKIQHIQNGQERGRRGQTEENLVHTFRQLGSEPFQAEV
jgi:hypothetical protein